MRRWIKTHVSSSRHFRFVTHSQLFFELYGKFPETMDGQAVHLGSTGASELSPVGTPAGWTRALEEISAQLYAAPQKGVTRSALRKVLQEILAPLALLRDRRSRCFQQFWERALDVWHHAEDVKKLGEIDPHSVALLIAVLYYSGKEYLVAQLVEVYWMRLSPRTLNESDICHILRSMAVYVLACSVQKKSFQGSMMERVKEIIESALHRMGGGVATRIAHEYRILFYALDWYFFHLDDPVGRQIISGSFTTLAPKRLRAHVFTTSPIDVSDVSGDTPPSALLRVGLQCATNGEKESLQRIFAECKRREEEMEGFRLFQVTTRLGELLSAIPGVDPHTLSDVVTLCGTSLNYESLKNIGMTRGCRSTVLKMLGRMQGPEAYFAARQVLFHHSPAEVLAFQETYGDLLLGNPWLTWRGALESMNGLLAQGNMSWRDTLPTVLRLLSDAGENVGFFQLLKKSHVDGDGASLMTASALGQATRRTGQWSRASDVLDMIISCNPPQSVAEDLFLEDACLQTMYTLRDAKRWKEALAFYTLLAPVMPQAAHRVICSAVCDTPASSAWEAALATVQTFGSVSEKFLTTLLCARDPDRVPASGKTASGYTWRYMLQGYAEGGHWQHALRCVQGQEKVNFSARLSLLRSAQRSPLGCLTRDFFDCLQVVWSQPEHLRLCVLVAEAHGYLRELYKALQKHRDNARAAEYHALVGFLMDGIPPPADMLFTDTYVVHRLLMSPLPSPKPISIRVAWTSEGMGAFTCTHRKDIRKFVQIHYKVHPSCVPKWRREGRQDFFTLHTIPSHSPLMGNDTLVAVQGDMVVAYKPPGMVTCSYARSVAQRSRAARMYSLAYLLAPSSCGLILLLASTIPTKAVCLTMKVMLRIYPKDSASPALLCTEFFEAYKMRVLAGPSLVDGCVVVVAACCSDPDGLLAGSLYRLREAIATEGWVCWEADSSDGGGESLHVAELAVSMHHSQNEGGLMHFSISPSPVWAHLAPEE